MVSDQVDVKALASTVAKELMNANRFVTFTDTKEVFVYQDGIYCAGGESFIMAKVQENVESSQVSNHLVLETIGQIQRSTFKDRAAFDSDNPHLVLQNCLLNLHTLEPEPFTPDRYELNKLPVKYDPAARCPLFATFIQEIVSHDDVNGIQEELGAILRKKYLTKKLSVYLGDTDTGKTTLLNVFLAFLGPENVSSVSIQDLASKNRFSIAELHGRLANIRDDLPKDVIYSVGKLKELTGGFQVQAEKKHRDPFNFSSYAYLLFSCNVLPPVEEDDNAFYNRVMIRKFNRKYGGHAKPDRELVDKLTTPEELSGILNWALEGLKRLQANGWNFTSTASTEETRLDYKRRSDPIWAFVDEMLDDSESEAFEPKEGLYNAFKEYCEANGFQNPGKDYFYKHLGDKVTVQSGRRGPKGKQQHCFVGVRRRSVQTLDGGKGDYHGYRGDEEGSGSRGSHGSHGVPYPQFAEGICELCGASGPVAKSTDGTFTCSRCRSEEDHPHQGTPNEDAD